ncbi:calreticulin family domain-containing protein [Ditylenchus destructor]|uniref:Calreticulin family domain-containing protein n=1 Tax=Ditylenchus destructor TaxID=166010 RepID=A0AAD4QV94_9BILA|nr:calreticulin family domain-containing protein [Ditylenchus destructor]
MAFGNGAPDIFSSIASVLSVPNPQAGLAISELLGGGIFVTSIVVASIILLQPFDVMRRPIIRDIGFFLVALSLLVFFVLYDNQIHWWQPALFLVIYGIYAFTVISGALVRQRIRKQKRQSRVMTKAIVAASKMIPKKSKSVIAGSKIAPAEVNEYKEANKNGFQQGHEFLDDGPKIFTPKLLDKNGNVVESTTIFPMGKLIIPVGESGDSEYQDRYSHVGDYVEAGKFFVKEKLDNEEDSETTDSSLIIVGENNEKMLMAAASNINREMNFSSALLYLCPIPNGPGLYAYVLLCSTALSVLILLFTRSDKEPKYYKPFAAYTGFAMSIAWIYTAAAEVVNVVMMFGSLFGISYQILGLTAVSWCNSIGDAIADFTVARQGFPRMGLSAAIGAPLFNLLVGFGTTFSIAKLQGKTVTVSVDGVKWTMFAALGLNLISTLVLLYIQRFSMRVLSCSSIVLFLLLNLVVFTSCKADDDFGDEDLVDETEHVAQTETETSNEEYVAPAFATPTLDKYSVHFVDWFDDLKAIGKRWLKSTAQKEGAEEAVAKYNGEWAIGSPSNVVINNDYGLIVKTKARHHAIAASLNKPFRFEGKPLVVQYEVKYEEGQECGGGYVKLLSVDPKAVFHDKTPYTIMFGPDKCGMSAKVHFILRLKNPKNGSVSEYHAKQPSRSLAPFFDDKKTHLYTLIVNPTNDFQVLIDNAEIIAGNLLKDLEPSVVPPQQIHDPEDKKPEDWDDREFIVDPEAKKPDDWDESAPKEIVDTDAKKV